VILLYDTSKNQPVILRTPENMMAFLHQQLPGFGLECVLLGNFYIVRTPSMELARSRRSLDEALESAVEWIQGQKPTLKSMHLLTAELVEAINHKDTDAANFAMRALHEVKDEAMKEDQ
jgi:hypothetical protein